MQLDGINNISVIGAGNMGHQIADATQRPDKVVNMHFFNLALVMKLVRRKQ